MPHFRRELKYIILSPMKLSIFVHFLTYKDSNFMLVSLIKHGLLSHPFRDLQPVVTVNCSVALLCLEEREDRHLELSFPLCYSALFSPGIYSVSRSAQRWRGTFY